MDRRLTFRYDFQCCDVRDGDYLYHRFFKINIDSLYENILLNPESFPLIEIDVEMYFSHSFLEGVQKSDEKSLENIDMSIPLILGELTPDLFECGMQLKRTCYLQQGYTIFDSHYQLIKAHQLGMKTMQAYVVHMEQFLSFITTTDGYEKYIAYWNEKVERCDESLARNRPLSAWESVASRMPSEDDSLPQA